MPPELHLLGLPLFVGAIVAVDALTPDDLVADLWAWLAEVDPDERAAARHRVVARLQLDSRPRRRRRWGVTSRPILIDGAARWPEVMG